MTEQEQQIYSAISELKYDVHPDAHGCRLKLFFVTYGCMDIMKYRFNLEDEVEAYVSKFERISACCRLSYEEEAFILSMVPRSSKVRTQHLNNREIIIKATFDLNFDTFTSKSSTGTFIPQLPALVPTVCRQQDPIDLEILDTERPTSNWLSKLTLGKYNKPEDCIGADAVKLILSLLDERRPPGFFLLYDLFVEQVSIKVLPDDSTKALASLLLYAFLGYSTVSLETTILQVMDQNPTLVPSMPIFEDKRKIKIPKFTGLDVFQSHVKAAAVHIVQRETDLNRSKLAGFPVTLYATEKEARVPHLVNDTLNFSSGREWLHLKVGSYTTHTLLFHFTHPFTT
jgi:hypothetical protein